MSSVATDRASASQPSAATGRAPCAPDDLVVFHRSLAAMCRSGIPLPRAFETLAADIDDPRLRSAIAALARDVEDGVPLNEAYAQQARVLPPAYGALVAAGLAAGDLPAALDEVARAADRRARVARAMRAALAGPAITACVVVLIGIVVAVVAGPRLTALVASVDAEGGAGRALTPTNAIAAALVALAVVAGVAVGFARWRPPLDAARRRTPLRLQLPVVGRIRLYAGLAGALGALAGLLRRHVPLGEALDLVTATADEPGLRGRLGAMAEAAHAGAGVESAARASGLLPPSQLWLLRAAEDRGAADEGLDDVADLYTARLERAVDRAAALLAPAAELVIGAVVFVLAYTYVIPLLEVSVGALSTR